MEGIYEKLGDLGLIPVIRIEDAAEAVPLGRALLAGGLPCAEITFRTAAAAEAIAILTRELPEMLIGAGTVLTEDQADSAMTAGARFIVSPGLDAALVRHCQAREIPVLPGVSNATEIQAALRLGLRVLKFFPAETSGGLEALKALSAPFGMVRFIPTGGISAANLLDYLAFPKVLACGGSWMAKPELISGRNEAEITRLTSEAVQTMLGFKLVHVGINTADEAEGKDLAGQLATLFNLPVRELPGAIFTGPVEVLKGKGQGTRGHLAIQTNNVSRAMAFLGRRGARFAPDTARIENGRPTLIYLEGEYGGFAIHLVEKS